MVEKRRPSRSTATSAPGSFVQLDFAREERIGLPEAIFCAGKDDAHLQSIVASLRARPRSARPVLFTRLAADAFARLDKKSRAALDYDALSRTAVLGRAPPPRGDPLVAVVTAGTSDASVAREAARTLTVLGVPHAEIYDVGVAGLWRLLHRLEELRRARAVICVAGMDAALPSVVGGLVPGLVIAVPTSTGYGVAAGGTTALHAALASCSSGVVVVNIDNGYGAACATLRSLAASGWRASTSAMQARASSRART